MPEFAYIFNIKLDLARN